MSDKPVPADCQRMILFREDLSGFVRAGDHMIEFQLSARAAADIAIDLLRIILKRHPHMGWPLAQQMWEVGIERLREEQLAELVESAPPQPEGVPPHAH